MLPLFRCFLFLLPREVRQEYGDELMEVVRAAREDQRGRLAVRFWARQAWAMARAGVRLRVEGRGTKRSDAELRELRGEGGGGMDGMVHDVRQALRTLRKRPGFTAVTAVTLGLGIGASTAIFSAVHAVLFRDLPYEDPDRIVAVFHENAESGERGSGLSPANARDIAEASELLSAVAVAEPWSLDLEAEGRTEAVRAWAVSEGFFDALGIEPLLGRAFSEDEYRGTGAQVVLVGHRSWQRRFGGDPELVGRTLTFQQGAVSVVGILAPDFKLPDEAEVWVPRPPQAHDVRQRSADYMMGVARMEPDAGLSQVQEELHRIGQSLA
ncbi:MAG: ABC transporter permease, partial [Longimicrobiales bacterium]|nr:ABC transporter permease [Longimicrobiales bacterium]